MKRLFAAAALAMALIGPAQAQAPALDKAAIEQIVRDLIRREPEIVLEALDALEKRGEAQQREAAKQALNQRRRELENDPDLPVMGNPRGLVVIVEFFDYRCPYCRRMAEPIKELLAAEKDVKLVRRDWPILGPPSVTASRAALAARAQGDARYEKFHDALMAARVQLDDNSIFQIARETGLDIDRLRRDMESPRIAAILQKNDALARALAFTGTPGFAIGDALVPGAVDLRTLKNLVAAARARPQR
jgi:protein-disulfide isomerase